MDWSRERGIAFERDEGRCQRCSRPASDVHHRVVRGRKNCNDPGVVRGLSGLVSLCRECHSIVHLDPAAAYGAGYMVRTGEDPAQIPLYPSGRIAIWLDNDGGRKVEHDWQF